MSASELPQTVTETVAVAQPPVVEEHDGATEPTKAVAGPEVVVAPTWTKTKPEPTVAAAEACDPAPPAPVAAAEGASGTDDDAAQGSGQENAVATPSPQTLAPPPHAQEPAPQSPGSAALPRPLDAAQLQTDPSPGAQRRAIPEPEARHDAAGPTATQRDDDNEAPLTHNRRESSGNSPRTPSATANRAASGGVRTPSPSSRAAVPKSTAGGGTALLHGRPLAHWLKGTEHDEHAGRSALAVEEGIRRDRAALQMASALAAMVKMERRRVVEEQNAVQRAIEDRQRWLQLLRRVRRDEGEARVVLYLVEDRAFREVHAAEQASRQRIITAARNRNAATSPTGKVRVGLDSRLADCLRRLHICATTAMVVPSDLSLAIDASAADTSPVLLLQRVGRGYLLRRGPVAAGRGAGGASPGTAPAFTESVAEGNALRRLLAKRRREALPALPPLAEYRPVSHASADGGPRTAPAPHHVGLNTTFNTTLNTTFNNTLNATQMLRKAALDRGARERAERSRRLARLEQQMARSQLETSRQEQQLREAFSRAADGHTKERVTIRERARVLARRRRAEAAYEQRQKDAAYQRVLDQRNVDEVELHVNLRMAIMKESRIEALKRTLLEVPGAMAVAAMSPALSLSKAERASRPHPAATTAKTPERAPLKPL